MVFVMVPTFDNWFGQFIFFRMRYQVENSLTLQWSFSHCSIYANYSIVALSPPRQIGIVPA